MFKLQFVIAFALVSLLLLIPSCYDQSSLEPLPFSDSPTTDKPEEYCEHHFAMLGEALAKGFQDQGFIESFYQSIDQKFDTEATVLFKTLKDENDLSMTNEGFQSMEAFYDIEEYSYYPHVYIPNYDQHKAADRIPEESPYVVLFVPGFGELKESQDLYTIQNGQLVSLNRQVTEEFAEENVVLVISLNETVDINGEVPEHVFAKITTEDQEKLASQSNNKKIDIDYYLDWMTIHVRKETGWGGKSDVSIIGWAKNFTSPGSSFPIAASAGNSGNLIRKYTKADVDNNVNFEVNFLVMENWEVEEIASQNETVEFQIAYVIFEHDSWPASLNTVNVNMCTYQNPLLFRSTDTDYMHEVIFGHNLSSGCPSTDFWDGYTDGFHPEITFTTEHF